MCLTVNRKNNSNFSNLNLRLNDKHHILKNKNLNTKFELNIYALCINDNLNQSTVTNKNLVVNAQLFEDSEILLKSSNMYNGFYLIELKQNFDGQNESKYCPPKKCPYLENDIIHCHECKKQVYFLNLKENIEGLCLKNTNVSSINEVANSDFEFNQKAIFNLNETFLINFTAHDIVIPPQLIHYIRCSNYKLIEFNVDKTVEDLQFALKIFFPVTVLAMLISMVMFFRNKKRFCKCIKYY